MLGLYRALLHGLPFESHWLKTVFVQNIFVISTLIAEAASEMCRLEVFL